jgi:hypothetical protein
VKVDINWGEKGTSQWENSGEANEVDFFAEEDFDDDEYDPFFDE